MLIQRRLHFLFVFEDVVETSRQFCSTFAVKNYLARANIAMRHTLVVHELESAQNLLCEMLQDGLGHRAYALR